MYICSFVDAYIKGGDLNIDNGNLLTNPKVLLKSDKLFT